MLLSHGGGGDTDVDVGIASADPSDIVALIAEVDIVLGTRLHRKNMGECDIPIAAQSSRRVNGAARARALAAQRGRGLGELHMMRVSPAPTLRIASKIAAQLSWPSSYRVRDGSGGSRTMVRASASRSFTCARSTSRSWGRA